MTKALCYVCKDWFPIGPRYVSPGEENVRCPDCASLDLLRAQNKAHDDRTKVKIPEHIKDINRTFILPPDTKFVAQVGGDHYQTASGLQHWDVAWQWGYLEGTATKYLARHAKKGKLQDILKALTYIQKIIMLFYLTEYEELPVEQKVLKL